MASCGSDGAAVSEIGSEADGVRVDVASDASTADQGTVPDDSPTAVADETDQPQDDDSGQEAAEEDDPVEAAGDGAVEVTEPPAEVELGTADWDNLVEWNLPALGGLRFGVPEGLVVHHDADMVNIRSEFALDSGRYDPTMIVARTHRSATGAPLLINDFVSSAIAGVGSAEPTNSTLTVFGETLEGWRFSVDEGQGLGPHYLYSAYPDGAGGPSSWQPFPLAELYLADVPGGVLAVGWIAQDETALAQARAIFDVVAPTLELAQPLADTAEALTPLVLDAPQPPPESASIPAGWPRTLTGLSKPLGAGDYSLGNTGTALSLTLGDGWWIQPNFPSWVVLTGSDSFGPGDRGILFRSGVEQLMPAVRGGDAGAGEPFDLQAMISTPPDNIEILESETVDVGGAQGIRVRIAFDATADCATEICEYMIATRYPFPPSSLRTGYLYELWHFDKNIAEPVTLIVETPDPAWFAHARTVINSIEFDTES